MDTDIASPSREDVDAVAWERVVQESAKAECWTYCSEYCKAAAEAEREDDERARNVYAFFARITWPAFHLDQSETPLGPPDRLDSFTEEELQLLAELVGVVTDPELQARIADILWLRDYGDHGKRDYRIGHRPVPRAG